MGGGAERMACFPKNVAYFQENVGDFLKKLGLF